MSSPEHIPSPRKRLKLSPDIPKLPGTAPASSFSTSDWPMMLSQNIAAHAAKEAEVGITELVSTRTPCFRGILKKRYTDFLVNEILPDGNIVHLQTMGSATAGQPNGNADPVIPSKEGEAEGSSSSESCPVSRFSAPSGKTETSSNRVVEVEQVKGQSAEVSVDDISKLITYLGEKATEELLSLNNKILGNPHARPRDHGFVTITIPAEKSLRTILHEDIRRMFSSRIDSATDKEKNLMTFSATVPQHRRPSNQKGYHGNPVRRQGKLGWEERGGQYLHFSLYKENKDTMEVISFLARQLRINVKNFQFAGTKDRRAVTVQRVSAYRVDEDGLIHLNKRLRNSAIGDFEYQRHGLELGDLKGNEFVMTLRECHWEHAQTLSIQDKILAAEQAVSQACQDLRQKGFFNYYGLQRFGTFSTRTDTVGVKLLLEDFRGACNAILHYSPDTRGNPQSQNPTEQISSDDKARADAIHLFQETGKVNEALEKLPKRFSAEGSIIRHLGKNKNDYLGAIQTIQRNLRLMYVHAYQSLVWNAASSERWRLFGNRVVEGDLVLVNEDKGKEAAAVIGSEEVDADGEVVIRPAGEDRAQTMDDVFERARALTADEAASGKYSIFDIVLPLPGYDVLYPANAVAGFYKAFMSSERGGGLDPLDMRRKHKDLSLSGSYRKVLAQIGPEHEYKVRAYKDDNEQFVETDVDIIKRRSSEKLSPSIANRTPEEGDSLAVILKVQLGSSQYATMALRELSKSGIQAYKPDFGGGR